jgi:FkbM family methyltransferase
MELSNLLNPVYLYRPSQILQRLSFKPSTDACLDLPWNCTINACSAETIGHAIATQGLYDLPVTEALMRLTDAAETALDVGANIGYMSLVLALSVGRQGRVVCFEPNPDLHQRLSTNVESWKSLPIASIEIKTIAVSDRDGEGCLGFPADYRQNFGVASLELGKGAGVPVKLGRLDTLEIRNAGVMKVDVEGHEAAVFAGGQNLLARKLIRDIVFEENDAYPARSHKILLEHGYKIFRLTRSAWRPLLLPPGEAPRQANVPLNFLATADPSRAQDRFRHKGWHALSTKFRHNR